MSYQHVVSDCSFDALSMCLGSNSSSLLMQLQRQQLHERQAAAFEQLRAVALVKVHFAFLNLFSMHCVFD